MTADPREAARRLFGGVIAPLVLGGAVRPGHAIGGRVAQSLAGAADAIDAGLLDRVQAARVRRARRLAPLDALPPPTAAEWMLAAGLHDVLQAANPDFDAPLRRRLAARILGVAARTLERVQPPANARDALSRHTLFARVLEVARTDTVVKWWTGSRTFLGVDPPARLRAWPGLRRVSVTASPRPLLALAPLAVDRAKLVEAVAHLLARTPLTDLATCAREAPAFAWTDAALGLVSTRAGRTLALRAIERSPAAGDADAALGRATRDLLATRRDSAAPAEALLAEREAARRVAPAAPAGGADGKGRST